MRRLTVASRESVRRWFHRFSRIFSVEKRFRNAVALDETVVKMYSFRVYVWSAVDVDSGEIPAIYASWSRNMLIATKFGYLKQRTRRFYNNVNTWKIKFIEDYASTIATIETYT